MSGIIWILSIFWAAVPLMGWGVYDFEPMRTCCTLDYTRGDRWRFFLLLNVCKHDSNDDATVSFFLFFFLVALNLQGLRDLHADPGGALPDLPSHHHAVVLRLHPQTLQEGPQPQGQCSMSASLFLESQADTHPRCAEGLEILLLIGSKS